MATRRKKAPPDNIRPFGQVVDVAHVNGWTVHLERDRNRKWTLDIRDRDDLVARGTSRAKTPECFREMGEEASRSLEKSGRLK